MEYYAHIQRTGRVIELHPVKTQNPVNAFTVAEENGYRHLDALDIKNGGDIQWEGIEFNRLLAKDGVLYRFNNWIGEYPFSEGIEIEEIGTVATSEED